VIPSVAIARCDVRLVAEQRAGRVADLFRAHLARVAPDVEFVPGNAMEPSRTPLGSPYLDAIRSGATASAAILTRLAANSKAGPKASH
jgi:hypothetical protein